MVQPFEALRAGERRRGGGVMAGYRPKRLIFR